MCTCATKASHSNCAAGDSARRGRWISKVRRTTCGVSYPALLFDAVRQGLGVSLIPALTAQHQARGALGFRVLVNLNN